MASEGGVISEKNSNLLDHMLNYNEFSHPN